MKGQKPIRTVQDLMTYLSACPADAEIQIMPEDGDGFRISGVLEFSAQKPMEVWLLMDEFGNADGLPDDWVAGEDDDDEEDKLGPMVPVQTSAACEREEPDVVVVRGKLRSA